MLLSGGDILDRHREVTLDLLHEQHLRFYRLLEELDSNIAARVSKDILDNLLQSLVEYTKIHFGDEEDFMLIYGFPELSAHRIEHNSLAMKIFLAREEWRAGREFDLTSFANDLHSWLADHIEKSDRKCEEYASANGLSA